MASSSPPPPPFLFLLCSFLLLVLLVATSATAAKSTIPLQQPPRGLVFPVIKDQTTNYTQYVTRIYQRTPLIPVSLSMDLGGENFWVDCSRELYVSSSYKSTRCGSKLCKTIDGGCQDCWDGPRPGCNKKACTTAIRNRMTNHLVGAEVAEDVFSVQSVNNGSSSTAGRLVSVPNLVFACGGALRAYQLEGTPDKVHGIAGFGRGKLGLPALLSTALKIPNKFAVCLSNSTRSIGVIYFGEKPYMMNPNRDISVYLYYTPLLIKPFRIPGVHLKNDMSLDYWIQVTAIKISGKKVPINTKLLKIDKEGYGGTQISTVHPYTIMSSSIYKPFKVAFEKEFSHMPRAKSVPPFELCYRNLPDTQVGPSSPLIDIVFHSEFVFWRIYGANSMVRVSKDVFCLGFLDGGDNREIGMIIGGHQMENNLFQFDLVNSRLGFSSTLLLEGTSCSKFNFKGSKP